ncbi:glycosyltransferase family 4 protein [Sphingobacterium mizutaii]|uniref:glycosyltransferase family 4 protein n=1 Tax=Sphingobacterium mizutaii TaxID=1010 RepID=UPI0028A19A4F|nr:glycosyltransferase family 4 protein [Sphingobacterium mizutaii]
MKKIIKIATVPESLNILLRGQFKFLSKEYEVIGISSFGENLDELRRREGIQCIGINMERKISVIKDFISLIKLVAVLKREKPDLVHSITPKAGLLAMMAAWIARVPIRIHTFTGLIFPTRSGFLQKVLIFMDKLICRFATNIYPEGEGVRNDLIKYRITAKPLRILANGNVNGVDLDYFNPSKIKENEICELKQKLMIEDSDFIFVFVGRLVGDKGINELVNAFKTLLSTANNCSVKLLLVGQSEPELDPLDRDVVTEIRDNPNIITVGFQKDIRPYLLISHTFVFPSHREGFPNVVLQAGAMGLPCIVTDISGSNEIIENGYNGSIVPVKDVYLLMNVMKDYVRNSENFSRLKNNSRLNIELKYSQPLVWGELEKEYKRLLYKNV